jgi:uncharacterized protein YciI
VFVIELLYKAPLAQIDANMTAHVAFLNKYYAAGNFLVSGRKIPRDGGIIVPSDRADAIRRSSRIRSCAGSRLPRHRVHASARERHPEAH